jgi:hypothetical protein
VVTAIDFTLSANFLVAYAASLLPALQSGFHFKKMTKNNISIRANIDINSFIYNISHIFSSGAQIALPKAPFFM